MMRLVFALILAGSTAMAQEAAQDAVPAPEVFARDEGLAAWDRIYAVASHPRCTNCHVGDQGRPMWQGLGYGPGSVHGMNIRADESRIGAESVPCRTCHVASAAPNTTAHAPPHIDDAWRLPPSGLEWLDKSSEDICAQLRNPDTNDGKSIDELVEHVLTSAFVNWGFAPGAGRSAPPGGVETMARDLEIWGGAGTPCTQDR